MSDHCPRCSSENVYQDRTLWVCPECGHEWTTTKVAGGSPKAVPPGCRDAYGQELQTGDSVIVVKDLKVKGASGSLKSGTKVRNIRVIDPEDGHNILQD